MHIKETQMGLYAGLYQTSLEFGSRKFTLCFNITAFNFNIIVFNLNTIVVFK